MKTEDILSEREKTHGDFGRVAALVGKLRELNLIYRREGLSAAQQMALEMIFLKIARIVCGDPNHADHWDDIAGYAMLGKENEESTEFEKQYCTPFESGIVHFYEPAAVSKGDYQIQGEFQKEESIALEKIVIDPSKCSRCSCVLTPSEEPHVLHGTQLCTSCFDSIKDI